MASVITLGLSEIQVGEAAPSGIMPTTMAKIGKTYKDTCKLVQAASEATEHYEEGKASPAVRSKAKKMPVLTFSMMDPDPQALADYIGGTVSGTSPVKWNFNGNETVSNKAIKIIAEQGLVFDIPNADIEAVINSDFSKKGIFLIDFTVTPLAVSAGGAIQAYEFNMIDKYMSVYSTFEQKPTFYEQYAQNKIVTKLINAGIWQKLDRLFVFAVSNENDATIDWIHPVNENRVSKIGTITHSNVGFKGNSALLGAINTNYNPATKGVYFQQNEASFGIYFQKNESNESGQHGAFYGPIASGNIMYIIPFDSSNQSRFIINQNTYNTPVVNNVSNNGLFCVVRDGNNVLGLVNGVVVYSQASTSTGVTNTNIALLANNVNDVLKYHSDKTISFAFFGSKLTTKESALISSCFDEYVYYKNMNYGSHYPLMPVPAGSQQHSIRSCAGKIYYASMWKKFYCYDPETNTWEEKAQIPYPETYRESFGLRAVGNYVYFIGGQSTGSITHADIWKYDTTNDVWEKMANMPTPREDFGSAVVGSNIYVFGGLINNGTTQTRTKKLEIYNTETNTWSTGADIPVFKQLGDFGTAHDRFVYAMGASDTVYAVPNNTVNPDVSCYKYDTQSNEWTRISDMPLSSVYRNVVTIGDYIYSIAGCKQGESLNTVNYVADIYRYDINTDSWSKTIDAPYPAFGSACCDYNGNVYMCSGGVNGQLRSGNRNFFRLNL